ncbi:Vang-like protein 1 [Halotydeus destructor]|nr:Vang-like protein 1 [Halotydeus destructor]
MMTESVNTTNHALEKMNFVRRLPNVSSPYLEQSNHDVAGPWSGNNGYFSSSKSDYGGGGGGGGGGRRNGGFRRGPHDPVIMGHEQERWADNITAITGNTSDHSISIDENMDKLGKEVLWTDYGPNYKCHMWSGTILSLALCACALVSPIIMVIVPKIETLEWKVTECGPECDGLLISFSFKLVILLIGTWAVFVRQPRATMPRIHYYRAIVMALIFVLNVSYWLFYTVRIAERRMAEYELSYQSIVMFASSLLDALLFVHYLAVILIEMRHLQPQYYVKVVRSPDGHSRSYNIGQLSIQRASVWILEKYYQDFPIYNAQLDMVPSKSRREDKQRRHKSLSGSTHGSVSGSGLKSQQNGHVFSPVVKYYDIESPNGLGMGHGGVGASTPNGHHVGLLGPASSLTFGPSVPAVNSLNMSHGLVGSLQRNGGNLPSLMGVESGPQQSANTASVRSRSSAIPMDPRESAQAIFPSMAKALQKYLRLTRQQPRHTMQSILNHLATCLTYNLSPKAFLEKYLVSSPILQNDSEHKPVQPWGLVCDVILSRTIEPGTVFLLRQDDVSLLVTVHALPHYNITEEILDHKSNNFVLRMQSETSV